MAELLLELLSEEIPARMQVRAAEDLRRLVTERLEAARLEFSDAASYVTPRRLALVVDGLPAEQPDITIERKGPKVGAPDKAVEGFLKSAGVTLDECEQRDTPKGKVWFAVKNEKGKPAAAVLSELLPDALGAFLWAKSMRWGSHALRWVRPIHSMLCVFDGEVVPLRFAHLMAGNSTLGHRVHGGGAFAAMSFEDYRGKLRAEHVILDAAERAKLVRENADRLAAEEGFTVKPDDALVLENAGLAEWPVVLMGRIDEAFMDVPDEVLTSAMRTHQKYFSVLDKSGKLAPRFITVANMETPDKGAAIIAGNERVLRARLSDAKFFWDQDRKQSLEGRTSQLSDIVFHAKLGTVAERVARLAELAADLCRFVPGADADKTRRAGQLCKADLVTEMVGEFPELQGVMGRYYAFNDGENASVADAIAEHYAPQGPGDICPSKPESVALALAEKIDTLVGFFAIDEKPTGSKDPFALRRAALGVIRLILENQLRVPLLKVFADSLGRYGDDVQRAGRSTDVGDALLAFFADRLKVHLREKGVRHDLVSAVFALSAEDDLVRLLARVDALQAFLEGEDGANLLTAYKRAANILSIEEKRDGATYANTPEKSEFRQDEERELHDRIGEVVGLAAKSIEAEAFAEAMGSLAKLRAPVDAFFDEVTVNCDEADLRRNRLYLLSEIRGSLDRVADFSKIEG